MATDLSALRCLIVGVGLLAGCKGIGRIPDPPPTAPLVLTPAEARETQARAWAVYQQVPRERARITAAAEELGLAARSLREDHAAHLQAAQAWAFVAEHDPTPAGRIAAAKRGITFARRARELRPDAAAGHYWYALNVGLLADADRAYGLDAVSEMDGALQRAIELDEAYDHGGPLRLLAILHLRTPPPPVGIGSNRRGLRLLERAVELAPAEPENHLYLAEAQHAVGRADAARASLATLRSLAATLADPAAQAHWEAAAVKLEQTWEGQ